MFVRQSIVCSEAGILVRHGSQIATLVYFSKLGILASATWTTFLWCVPAVIAGTSLGLWLFERVDDGKFRQLILLFLLFSGATLII
jgi:uncharacterized membrane protein YfcA